MEVVWFSLDLCGTDVKLKYLFLSKDCYVSSLLSRLTIHLLRRHLFWTLRSMTPRPPWSLGQKRISHLAKRYFFLSKSPCQKKCDLYWSSFLRTPLGISKKDNMNVSRLLISTEFRRTNLSSYDKCLAFQHVNFFSKCSSTFLELILWSYLWCIGIPKYLKGYSPALHPKSLIYSSSNSFTCP